MTQIHDLIKMPESTLEECVESEHDKKDEGRNLMKKGKSISTTESSSSDTPSEDAKANQAREGQNTASSDADETNQNDFEAMLLAAVDQQLEPPQPGSLVEGRVIHVGEEFIVMDIGYRVEGVIPIEEFTDNEGHLSIKEGDLVKCVVLRYDIDADYIPLSKRQADIRESWARIEECYQTEQPVTGKVMKRLRGGYFLDIQGIRAFLPGSQVDIHRVENYDEWLGKEIQVKILSIDPQKRTVVVSRRRFLADERNERRRSILANLKIGLVLEGVVKNVTDYGVFVDLGGIDGMIHKSDLTWQRIEHPSDVVEVGQTLKVKVLAYDPKKERISLGLKQLETEPFQQAVEKYKIGDVVRATVTNVVEYGAFVELEPGVTGLIHASELSWSPKIRRPNQLLKNGDVVEVRIIEVDSEKHRISLSLRQVEANPVDLFLKEHPVGSVVEAKITRFNMRGAIAEFDGWPNVLGFIPVREINWARNIKPPSEYLHRSQVVQAKILRGRPDLVRVYLSLRQLSENPWKTFGENHDVGDIIQGTVVEKFDRGCFIRLKEHPDLEALLPRGHFLRKKVRARRMVQEAEVGQEIEVKIIQMNPGKRRIVVSQRALIEDKVKKDIQVAREKIKKTDKIRIGDVISKEWEKIRLMAKKVKDDGDDAPEAPETEEET